MSARPFLDAAPAPDIPALLGVAAIILVVTAAVAAVVVAVVLLCRRARANKRARLVDKTAAPQPRADEPDKHE
jgi:hypothetical protein